MSDTELMRILKFDASDLTANRNRQVSKNQKERLAKEARGEIGCAAVLGTVLLAAAAVGVVGVFAILPTAEGSSRVLLIVGFGIIWPLVWGSIGVGIGRRAFARIKGDVQRVEGPVEVVKTVRRDYNSETNTYSNETQYILRIGGRGFHVSAALQNALKVGEPCAVYFVEFNVKEKQPQVLSAERIGNGSHSLPLDDAEVVAWLQKGDKLKAIKAHRALYGSDFENARAAVEAAQSRLGL